MLLFLCERAKNKESNFTQGNKHWTFSTLNLDVNHMKLLFIKNEVKKETSLMATT